MTKKLDDLPTDVENLFDPNIDHEASEELLTEFTEGLKEVMRSRLKKQKGRRSPDQIVRFSSLGKPDRQLWMEAHPDEDNEETMSNQVFLKFLYGDVIEALFLYLAKEAGHEVSREQEQVEHDGTLGHIDCFIDGVLTDTKSASSYGYQKFKNGTVEQDDAFGYVEQLAGYAHMLAPSSPAAWWAVDKVTGSTCISYLPVSTIKHYDPVPIIERQRDVIASDTPPPLCYDPVPDGKSGNMKLPIGCSYCKHKYRCHPDVRLFLYSGGPRWLTKVAKVPNVPESKERFV